MSLGSAFDRTPEPEPPNLRITVEPASDTEAIEAWLEQIATTLATMAEASDDEMAEHMAEVAGAVGQLAEAQRVHAEAQRQHTADLLAAITATRIRTVERDANGDIYRIIESVQQTRK